jgi:hypothetical protein
VGSLTVAERSEATAIAKHEQRKVTGTFIGATAFITQGTPFDPEILSQGRPCTPSRVATLLPRCAVVPMTGHVSDVSTTKFPACHIGQFGS